MDVPQDRVVTLKSNFLMYPRYILCTLETWIYPKIVLLFLDIPKNILGYEEGKTELDIQFILGYKVLQCKYLYENFIQMQWECNEIGMRILY